MQSGSRPPSYASARSKRNEFVQSALLEREAIRERSEVANTLELHQPVVKLLCHRFTPHRLAQLEKLRFELFRLVRVVWFSFGNDALSFVNGAIAHDDANLDGLLGRITRGV